MVTALQLTSFVKQVVRQQDLGLEHVDDARRVESGREAVERARQHLRFLFPKSRIIAEDHPQQIHSMNKGSGDWRLIGRWDRGREIAEETGGMEEKSERRAVVDE